MEPGTPVLAGHAEAGQRFGLASRLKNMRKVSRLAGFVVMLAAAGCGSGSGTAVVVSHNSTGGQRPKVAVPGRPVPSAAIKRLTALADGALTENGAKSVAWATAVVTTQAKAFSSADMGSSPIGENAVVYLVTIKGHFNAAGAAPGSVGGQPGGTYMSLVYVAKTFWGTAFGLRHSPPSGSPASLGPVTYLSVHSLSHKGSGDASAAPARAH